MSRVLQVDAFTNEPFRGNPAAVVLLETKAPDAWMAKVAAEMNLSETAFLLREADAWRLRWFTPTIEIELCGHATLASAFALWTEGLAAPGEPIAFDTLSGRLVARRETNGFITLDLPTRAATPCPTPSGLEAALGLDAPPLWVGRNAPGYVLVEIAEEARVRSLTPDIAAVAKLDARAVIVTARGKGDVDFVSRFFGPNVGVNEDPVTGSAHCMLGPYWKEKLGKNELRAQQVSARSGTLLVRPEAERTFLSGEAVMISRGELLAPFEAGVVDAR